ncbi:MAG TPA: hypothetical protein V6D20_05955 [Candidatus Obscuribacterales bacterium]
MRVMLLGVLKTLLATFLTERFLLNLIVLLADWAAKKTSNDLDNKMVDELRKSLDKQEGWQVWNLYEEVKEKKVTG